MPARMLSRHSSFSLLLLACSCGGATASDPSSPPPDAGAPTRRADAGAGASSPTSPTSTRWCSGQTSHAFCADFDGDYAADGWQAFAGGPIQTVPSDRSPPFALSVVSPGGPSDQPPPPGAVLMKQLKQRAPHEMHVAFDIRLDALGIDDDSGQIMPIAVYLATELGSAPYVSLDIQLRRGKAALEVFQVKDDESADGQSFATADLASLPLGQWVRVEIALAAGSTGGFASVTYDGAPAGATPLAPFETGLIEDTYVLLGVVGQTTHAGTFSAAIDDLVTDVK